MAFHTDLVGVDGRSAQTIMRERAAWRDAVARTRARCRLDELIGMPIPDARAVVESAGAEFATDDGPVLAYLSANRVIARVVNGRVTDLDVG